MSFSLIWLPEVLENAGLKVAEVPGWQDRGRGDVKATKGVMCHHTVGPRKGNMPSLRVLSEGRSGLKGPLSELGLGRDGTFYIIAAGRANHAGRGSWQDITQGNSRFIGIEAENTGKQNDFPWPEVQMDACRRGVAAILSHIGADPLMCCGHKEFAPQRKIDPLFAMDVFRMEVAAIMNGDAPPVVHIPATSVSGRPTLRRGMEGELVKVVQSGLNVVVDGDFGPKTEAAVRALQRRLGLVPDGIVGPKTWAAIDGGARLASA